MTVCDVMALSFVDQKTSVRIYCDRLCVCVGNDPDFVNPVFGLRQVKSFTYDTGFSDGLIDCLYIDILKIEDSLTIFNPD